MKRGGWGRKIKRWLEPAVRSDESGMKVNLWAGASRSDSISAVNETLGNCRTSKSIRQDGRKYRKKKKFTETIIDVTLSGIDYTKTIFVLNFFLNKIYFNPFFFNTIYFNQFFWIDDFQSKRIMGKANRLPMDSMISLFPSANCKLASCTSTFQRAQ